MSRFWILSGCFLIGTSASYGLHFLSVIIPWWGVETVFLGWLLFIVLIACLWGFDEVLVEWFKSKVTTKEYYLFVSTISLSIALGVIRWVLA